MPSQSQNKLVKLEDNLELFASHIATFLEAEKPDLENIFNLIKTAQSEFLQSESKWGSFRGWYNIAEEEYKKLLMALQGIQVKPDSASLMQSIMHHPEKNALASPVLVLRLQAFMLFLQKKKNEYIDQLLFNLIENVKEIKNKNKAVYEDESFDNLQTSFPRLRELLINALQFRISQIEEPIKELNEKRRQEQLDRETYLEALPIKSANLVLLLNGENCASEAQKIELQNKFLINIELEPKITLTLYTFLGDSFKLPLTAKSAIVRHIEECKQSPVLTKGIELRAGLYDVVEDFIDQLKLKVDPAKTALNHYILRTPLTTGGAYELNWCDSLNKEHPVDLALHPALSQFLASREILSEADLFQLKIYLMQIHESGKVDNDTKELVKDSKVPLFWITLNKKKINSRIVTGAYVFERIKEGLDLDSWCLYLKEIDGYREIQIEPGSNIEEDLRKILRLEQTDPDDKLIKMVPIKKRLLLNLRVLQEGITIYLIEDLTAPIDVFKVNSFIFYIHKETKVSQLFYLDKFHKKHSISTEKLVGLDEFQKSLKKSFIDETDLDETEIKAKLAEILKDFKPKTEVTSEKQVMVNKIILAQHGGKVNLIVAQIKPQTIPEQAYFLTKEIIKGKAMWVLYLMKEELTLVDTSKWIAFNSYLKGNTTLAPEDLNKDMISTFITKAILQESKPKPKLEPEPEPEPEPKLESEPKKTLVKATASALVGKLQFRLNGGEKPKPPVNNSSETLPMGPS